MNSIVAFEGLIEFASQLPRAAWQSSVFGCFDRDPFAARLPFDITTMRQDVEAIIPEAFALADGPIATTLPAPP